MFSKFAILITSTLVLLTAATPTTRTEPASDCTTAPVQCCESVVPSSSSAAQTLFGPLGIVLDNPDILVGLTCTPISVIGVGGDSCSSNAVCCEDNSHEAISIGCVPVVLS